MKNAFFTENRRLQGALFLLLAACFIAGLSGCGRSKVSSLHKEEPAPEVYIKKTDSGGFQLIVKKEPFLVKGVCYSPVPIGENHEYDFFSDQSCPWKKDALLMKELGINAVRLYTPGANPETVKKVVSGLYSDYGIYTIMGSWLGFWDYPLAYGDVDFRNRIKQETLLMVDLYKDTPGILMWVLGNENNYSISGQVNPWSSPEIDKIDNPAGQQAKRGEVYYSFVNDVAAEIKRADPNHPVALGNGELRFLEFAAKSCPDIDLVACQIYRGKTFGNLFNSLKFTFDKPILISEFGADAYNAKTNEEDQNMQAFFLESQWRQIFSNVDGSPESPGNCIGGVMFEWNDEWWKHNEYDPGKWSAHDTESNWSKGEYYFDIEAPGGMNMNEEWFGIVALSPESEEGINKRLPRKSYYVLRELFKDPSQEWISKIRKDGKRK